MSLVRTRVVSPARENTAYLRPGTQTTGAPWVCPVSHHWNMNEPTWIIAGFPDARLSYPHTLKFKEKDIMDCSS